jgi:thioredoxin-dependent peroxiredoxin
MEERNNAVTLKGKAVTLLGPEIKVGQKAPDFSLLDSSMKEVKLSKSKGKVRLLNVVYSIETAICDLQIRTFEEEAGKYKNVVIYAISMDLPFGQARYTKEHDLKNTRTLSDHREGSFGLAYGLLIKENRLLARSIFIIDAEDTVRYVEYVKEVAQAPDYEKAIKALKKVAG